ncbi:helix-turn-helix domain-containing protein [Companilactobacillus sp. DQM5]|uniref:helix-turn-helix domain-containing protein n=1 Tax=Companilactobacillus sp. DQM5 TaxID=3463359 RepID=UPI004059CFAB
MEKKTLKEWVNEWNKEKGHTKVLLAKEIGITIRYFYFILDNVDRTKLGTIKAIAKAIGISLDNIDWEE